MNSSSIPSASLSQSSAHTDKKRFFGKYRGTVINPIDETLNGKILVEVSVGGTPMSLWAEPCTPYAGPGVGFYAIPPTGAGVWIEFMEGDLDYPIWTGCYWGEGHLKALFAPDIPSPATAPGTVILRTPTTQLKLSLLTGEVTLESLMAPATPAMPTRVHLTPEKGVEISYLKNKLCLTQKAIELNNPALVVTAL